MKIALVGYGKMGRMIEEIARSRGHEIVSIIDVDNASDFESEAFRSAEVAIEFTAPHAALGNVRKCFEAGVKVVSGSTGWLAGNEAEMKQFCEGGKKTLLWSSNFSVGVAVFAAVNKYLARIMNNYPNYEVSMTEVHHIHKLDAPSGTALRTAQLITESRESIKQGNPKEEELIKGARGAEYDGMRIHSVRLPGYVAHQEVIFGGLGQTLSIRHDSISRESFMPGVVLACKKVQQLEGLVCGLENILD